MQIEAIADFYPSGRKYRERIMEISGAQLRGELGREAAAEQLWDLLTLAMERQEWRWAKLVARHLSVVCEGVAGVESKLAGVMGVLQEKGDPDAMLLWGDGP